MSEEDRTRYVVFNCTQSEATNIRKLIHDQDWYTGADMVIRKGGQYSSMGGIYTGRISEDLTSFFDYLKRWAEKNRRPT
ncbi:MAG TPA: hypothetical protein PKJ52_01160 [Rectinema sp.]|nr:hypothetical protein [Rectinema sp.]